MVLGNVLFAWVGSSSGLVISELKNDEFPPKKWVEGGGISSKNIGSV